MDRRSFAGANAAGPVGAGYAPRPPRSGRRRRPRLRLALLLTGLMLGVILFAVWWGVLRIVEYPSWPPPPDAVTAEGAQAATEAFAARENPRRNDVAIPYAPSTVSDVQFFADGRAFYPSILDDLSAATSSIHILQFGFKPGFVADQFVPVLEQQVRDGVEVRVIVDGLGSRPRGVSQPMFEQLADAGVHIVVNNPFPLNRTGLFPDQTINWRHDELGRADHRKMYVIDGVIGWVGGAGIEDHFADGRFYDVFARVEGDIVRQLQAVFLTSFYALGGPLPSEPDALAMYFPEPADPGTIPATLVQNIPGGFLAGTQSIREAIGRSESQLDIMNTFLTDDDMTDLVVAASERGVAVRHLVSRDPDDPINQAMRHSFGRLLSAGVEIWEFPAAMHAKVIIADDVTFVGAINLDAWSLYRNLELALRFESIEVADQARAELADDGIAHSSLAQEPSGAWTRTRNWMMSQIAYFL